MVLLHFRVLCSAWIPSLRPYFRSLYIYLFINYVLAFSMIEVTVGYVAGFIAAAIVVGKDFSIQSIPHFRGFKPSIDLDL